MMHMNSNYLLHEIKELKSERELVKFLFDETLDDLIRSAAASNPNLKDEFILHDFALSTDLNYRIRRGAIRNPNLKDQSLFIDIGLNDENIQIRRAAIKRITNQDVLIHIARESPDFPSRLIAVEMISDLAVRLDIAVKDSNDLVSFKALDVYNFLSALNSLFYAFSHGQRYIEEVLELIEFIDLLLSKDFNTESHDALNDFKTYLNKLKDREVSDLKPLPYHLEKSFSSRVLTNMAILTWELSFAIIDYLDDDYELLKIFNVHGDLRIRMAALKKIKSRHFLIDIISDTTEGYYCWEDYLFDLARRYPLSLDDCLENHEFSQEELIDLVRFSRYKKTRRKAVKYIRDIPLLEEWALNDSYPGLRRVIVALPRFKNQEILSTIALNDSAYSVRYAAIRNVNFNDDETLSKLAVEDPHWLIREYAASQISDESILNDLAVNDSSCWVICKAITNPNFNSVSALRKLGNHPNLWVSKNIAGHPLTDDETLIDIALNNRWNCSREKAINRIRDRDVLKYISENDDDGWISLIAESRLKELNDQEN